MKGGSPKSFYSKDLLLCFILSRILSLQMYHLIMCLFLICRPRSRGKTAAEDEDSMDGLESAETENTVETGARA